MGHLAGRTALVTGASRGIGRAIALRLARDGAAVAVHYGHDETAAKETVHEIHALGSQAFEVQAELGLDGDVERLFAGFDRGVQELGLAPGLDILVNNAGIAEAEPIESTERADFRRLFQVNVEAPFFVTQQALPRLHDGGRIINISTGLTRTARPDRVAYSMTKGALDVLAPNLAQQLGPRGITVNTVAPGVVDTDMNASWLRADPELRAYAASLSALGRVGEPADIADVVAFLASPDARWVTGHWMDATGGSLL